MATRPDTVEVSCVVDATSTEAFAAAVAKAERVGLHVAQQLAEIGVLIGTIDPRKLAALQRVPDIGAVEVVGTVHALQQPAPLDAAAARPH